MENKNFKKVAQVNSDIEYQLIKSLLDSCDIPSYLHGEGFGSPVKSIIFGDFSYSSMDVYVDDENYKVAKEILSAENIADGEE
jgi:hypothetical protein